MWTQAFESMCIVFIRSENTPLCLSLGRAVMTIGKFPYAVLLHHQNRELSNTILCVQYYIAVVITDTAQCHMIPYYCNSLMTSLLYHCVGLDSASSYELLTYLNRLADSQRTVIMTIHQPRMEIFHMFTRLIMLCEGQVCVCLSVCVSVCLYVCLHVYRHVCTCVCILVCTCELMGRASKNLNY